MGNPMANTNRTPRRSGLLSDGQILTLCNEGKLISEGFEKNGLSGCTYEFRVGEISYTYDYEKKVTRQKRGSEHLINPFETITLVTMEKVNLDSSHFLALYSKGSLFSLGLTAVSTAADPGFRGHLGITMTNLSARPIRLSKGTGFLKGYFVELAEPSLLSYTGQHGDATMSWPYPSQFHTEPPDFEALESNHWQYLPLPVRVSLIRLRYINRYMKWLIVVFVILLLGDLSILYFSKALTVGSFLAAEQIINSVAAFAQIVGLIFSVSLFLLNRGNK